MDGRIHTLIHSAIGRAREYEHADRQVGVRVLPAIAGMPQAWSNRLSHMIMSAAADMYIVYIIPRCKNHVNSYVKHNLL